VGLVILSDRVGECSTIDRGGSRVRRAAAAPFFFFFLLFFLLLIEEELRIRPTHGCMLFGGQLMVRTSGQHNSPGATNSMWGKNESIKTESK
jgi:hypothetical protein